VIVYGRNAVREAIRGTRSVGHVWATRSTLREEWLSGLPSSAAGRVSPSTPDEIERRCASSAHQGVCAEVEAFRYAEVDWALGVPDALIVALDQVQDPQNLGSICRTAECAGVTAIVIPDRRSVEITPAVCKASAGAVEHLPVARVRNLSDFLRAAKGTGMWCYGADAGAAVSYREIDYTGAVVLVLGSEGRGLRPRVAAGCDALVAVPLKGAIESLSVAAAAAVLLYTAQRARDTRPPP